MEAEELFRERAVGLVRACVRDAGGGSPTAVVDEAGLAGLGDRERARVAGLAGASHAVFVDRVRGDLRFFTSEGELPACGHGTVAALAYLAEQGGTGAWEGALRAGGTGFTGRAARDGAGYRAAFRTRAVRVREAAEDEAARVRAAFGGGGLADGARVATLGRPRMLLPAVGRAALRALAPDLGRLRAACDRLGLLGVYVYSPPEPGGRLAARMFAPSIGVPEDIANANSTACLAAYLAGAGAGRLAVDMGDALGVPAAITAEPEEPAGAGAGVHVHVGGRALFAAG